MHKMGAWLARLLRASVGMSDTRTWAPTHEKELSMNLDDYLPYMRDVVRCEASLRELNLMWRVIEAMAEMNCGDDASGLLPMIAATRQGFERLERDLVDSLVRQRVDNVMAEVGTQARDVIDIVVRNLYERTADVGFLATDRELCEYVAGLRTAATVPWSACVPTVTSTPSTRRSSCWTPRVPCSPTSTRSRPSKAAATH